MTSGGHQRSSAGRRLSYLDGIQRAYGAQTGRYDTGFNEGGQAVQVAARYYGKPDIQGRDEPGAFVAAVKEAVTRPAQGTSNHAAEDMRSKYADTFAAARRGGVGTTVFGPASADGFRGNSFDIRPFPEEALNDTRDGTYHKYGVLTYLGPADPARGVTKDWVLKNVLEDRYSFPNKGLAPAAANFDGKTQVYAAAPWSVDNPSSYRSRIGVVEQMRVPDGVLNITTDVHKVYPGTIRGTVMEVDGGLYIFTSGAGLNRYDNSGDRMMPGNLRGSMGRDAVQYSLGYGNDTYGPQAFRALDQQAVKYINSVRGAGR